MKKGLRIFVFFALLFSYNNLFYAQNGPGGVGNTNGTGSLKAWFKANAGVTYDINSVITGWANQVNLSSLNLSTITNEPTYSPSTLNNFPVIEFAGIDRLNSLNFNASDFPSSAATIFIVSVTNSGNNTLLGTYPSNASNQIAASLPDGSNQSTFNFGDQAASAGLEAYGTYYITTFAADGTSGQSVYINNGTPTTNATIASYSHTTETFQIGNGLDGSVAEVVVFSANVNSTQRNIINNYLATKYNLTLSANIWYTGNDAAYYYNLAGIGQVAAVDNHLNASSAGVYIQTISGLDDGEHILFAHNNASNTATINDVPAGIQQRWTRDWYIDETGDQTITITFDLPEAISGGDVPDVSNYVLLYRSGTTGDYTDLGITPVLGDPDQIAFTLTGAELTDGYYTLGTSDQTLSPLKGATSKT